MIDKVTKFRNSENENYQFSVLIPTWNNLAYLQLCIASIQKNSTLNVQIIVFVNEGNDGTIEWLKEEEKIDYIYSDENVGICYALNISRTLVKSDYIVYLNDDMYVLPNWDVELFNEVSNISTKMFMISSTMIEPIDTRNPCVIVRDYGSSIESFNEELLLEEYHTLAINDWSGSTWPPNVVHKDLWDMVGGLSIEFSPGMYSDPDFSRKLYEAGVRVFKGVGKSMVYHFGSKSTKRLRRSIGRELFILKWGITSNTFRSKTLHMGKPYNKLKERKHNNIDFVIGKLKILRLLFSSNKRR